MIQVHQLGSQIGDYPLEEDRIHWRVSIKEAA